MKFREWNLGMKFGNESREWINSRKSWINIWNWIQKGQIQCHDYHHHYYEIWINELILFKQNKHFKVNLQNTEVLIEDWTNIINTGLSIIIISIYLFECLESSEQLIIIIINMIKLN